LIEKTDGREVPRNNRSLAGRPVEAVSANQCVSIRGGDGWYWRQQQEQSMNLTVTGRHLDVTNSLKHYITEKMDRLERHFDNVSDIHVILSVEKLRQKAEATIVVSGGKIYADTIDGDMYAAIDLLTDKLDRQVIKHKEKAKDHHRRERVPE